MLQGSPCPGSTALPKGYFGSSIPAGLGPAGLAGPSGIAAGSQQKVNTDLASPLPWNSSQRGNAGPENGALKRGEQLAYISDATEQLQGLAAGTPGEPRLKCTHREVRHTQLLWFLCTAENANSLFWANNSQWILIRPSAQLLWWFLNSSATSDRPTLGRGGE